MTGKHGDEETFNKEMEPAIGTINTIACGFRGGGDTQKARKRHVRAVSSVQEIPFGFQHPDIVVSTVDLRELSRIRMIISSSW